MEDTNKVDVGGFVNNFQLILEDFEKDIMGEPSGGSGGSGRVAGNVALF